MGRRNLLRAAGASTLLTFGAGAVAAQSDENGDDGGSSSDDGNGGDDSQMDGLDPIFGLASAGPNPCMGEAGDDCFESFDVTPSHEVKLEIDLPQEVLPFAAPGVLDEATLANINAAVADGVVDTDELDDPEMEVTAQTPSGEEVTLTVEEIATLLADSLAFHFEPAGLAVEPGDVVLFSAETPDHAFAAYHERHGRTNRVPDDVGPISSPLVPVGGYWLYQFETEGVYDAYCPPHEVFGMVMRVVVGDPAASGDGMDDDSSNGDGMDDDSSNGDGMDDDASGDDSSNGDSSDDMDGDSSDGGETDTGRPPDEENLLSVVLGGFDPNIPSAAAALESAELAPETIVSEGTVSWDAIVEAYRSGSSDEE